MLCIRDDIQVLRDKASECEHAAKFAIDDDSRAINRKRAKLYRELIDDAELTLRRSQLGKWHAAKSSCLAGEELAERKDLVRQFQRKRSPQTTNRATWD